MKAVCQKMLISDWAQKYATSIQLSPVTGSLREASQGLSHPFLKTFATAFPDPTVHPWVSEDAFTQIQDLENAWKKTNEFYIQFGELNRQ